MFTSQKKWDSFSCSYIDFPSLHRDLSDNRIDSVHGKPFKGLGQLHDLLLSYNEIATIPFDAFHGMPSLQSLYVLFNIFWFFENTHTDLFEHYDILFIFLYFRDMEGNLINFIHEDAFSGFLQLEDL